MQSRYKRQLILVILDSILLPISVWLSLRIHLYEPASYTLKNNLWLLPFSSVLGITIYSSTSFYKSITRFTNSRLIYSVAFRNLILIALLFSFGSLFGLSIPSKRLWLIIWFFSTTLTGISRLIMRDLINIIINIDIEGERKKVVIYGAGYAGAQLLSSLRIAKNFSILFFIDDSPTLWNMDINGIKIRSPEILKYHKSEIDQILLAIPSASLHRKREIVNDIKKYQIPLLQVPSLEDISSGKYRISSLQPIKVEDLLGRKSVLPDQCLIKNGIEGKRI